MVRLGGSETLTSLDKNGLFFKPQMISLYDNPRVFCILWLKLGLLQYGKPKVVNLATTLTSF